MRFEKIVFVGGGVQYQQLTAGWQWPGWFDFVWCGTAPFFPIVHGSNRINDLMDDGIMSMKHFIPWDFVGSKRFGSAAGA